MVRAHPEIRALIGPDGRTAVVIGGAVALQLAIACAVRDWPWYAAFVPGYLVGVLIAHALGVAIHDCAHDLVFRRRWANKALSVFANLPLLFPAAVDFRDKHLAHHRNLGVMGRDTQMPSARERALTGRSWWKKVLWLTFGPVVFHAADQGAKKPRRSDPWMTANAVLCLGFAILVLWLSPAAFVYLATAGWLAFGPHPVGIRRYAEHVALRPGQPTYSYYGAFNRLALNVGYHVEHHDFPGIPWTRLPRLRRLAPEFYDDLACVRSWTGLLLSFFFDPRYPVDRYARHAGEAAPRERGMLPDRRLPDV